MRGSHVFSVSLSKIIHTALNGSVLTPTEVVIKGLTSPNPNKLAIRPAGEMGQGLFTDATILKGSFICEYKVPKPQPPFPRHQHAAVEAEYKYNNEGSYIFEAQDSEGHWWCFDATRCLNQYGRYMNHAPAKLANATPVPPVLVEGHLRVGFVTKRDISSSVTMVSEDDLGCVVKVCDLSQH